MDGDFFIIYPFAKVINAWRYMVGEIEQEKKQAVVGSEKFTTDVKSIQLQISKSVTENIKYEINEINNRFRKIRGIVFIQLIGEEAIEVNYYSDLINATDIAKLVILLQEGLV